MSATPSQSPLLSVWYSSKPGITFPPHKLTIIPGLWSQCGLQGLVCNHSMSTRITISVRRSSTAVPAPPHTFTHRTLHLLSIAMVYGYCRPIYIHNMSFYFTIYSAIFPSNMNNLAKAEPEQTFQWHVVKKQQRFACWPATSDYFHIQLISWLIVQSIKREKTPITIAQNLSWHCWRQFFTFEKLWPEKNWHFCLVKVGSSTVRM